MGAAPPHPFRGAMQYCNLAVQAGVRFAERLERVAAIESVHLALRYIADITRVWPVGGKFTPAQRAAYEAVLVHHR